MNCLKYYYRNKARKEWEEREKRRKEMTPEEKEAEKKRAKEALMMFEIINTMIRKVY